ncbi:MAG TPA: hypothetical protein VFC37_01235 [Terracidiphilus sp.]|nr:hypothetical protein [Terracidiphilus sp.]
MTSLYCRVWCRPGQVNTVLETRIQNSHFNGWAQQCTPGPRPSADLLSLAVVGGFPEVRKWGFGDNRTEFGLIAEGFKELSCSHGVSQPIDAVWALGLLEPIEPAANVVSLS